jgi:hypothetical protein
MQKLKTCNGEFKKKMPMQAFDWIQILQPKPEVRDTASKMLSRWALNAHTGQSHSLK